MKIAILSFDEVDLLDAGEPCEVFLTASRLVGRSGHAAPFEVVTGNDERFGVRRYAPERSYPDATAQLPTTKQLSVAPRLQVSATASTSTSSPVANNARGSGTLVGDGSMSIERFGAGYSRSTANR